MRKLNASESVYGFCSWLTTRKEIVKFGSSCDCAVIANLIQEFCETNKLPNIRGNYYDHLTFPTENNSGAKKYDFSGS